MTLILDGKPVKQETGFIPTRQPNPPRLKNFRILSEAEYDWTIPYAVDAEGIWYGGRGATVRKSLDGGLTWENLYQLGGEVGNRIGAVIALDNGELVVTTLKTSLVDGVWVSSEGQTVWEQKLSLTPDTEVNQLYGWYAYDNIVLLNEYGEYNPVNTPRKIYLSKDYGQTWTTIWDGPVGDTRHQHDVVFDPWANRIWQSRGDGLNGNISYSDDWGETWTDVYPGGVAQSTAIVPMPHCVLFGRDQEPDGIDRWDRDPRNAQALVRPQDIRLVYKLGAVPNPTQLCHVAAKYWIEDGVYYIPFTSYLDRGYGRVVATPDGHSFFEVWRADSKTHRGIYSFVGVDGNGKWRGVYNTGSAPRVWTADPIVWDDGLKILQG